MSDQLVNRCNAVWIYKTGRFAAERQNGVLAQALSHPSSAALVDSKGAPMLGAPFVLCGGPEKQHISNEVLRGP
jgi:hypothetical protein